MRVEVTDKDDSEDYWNTFVGANWMAMASPHGNLWGYLPDPRFYVNEMGLTSKGSSDYGTFDYLPRSNQSNVADILVYYQEDRDNPDRAVLVFHSPTSGTIELIHQPQDEDEKDLANEWGKPVQFTQTGHFSLSKGTSPNLSEFISVGGYTIYDVDALEDAFEENADLPAELTSISFTRADSPDAPVFYSLGESSGSVEYARSSSSSASIRLFENGSGGFDQYMMNFVDGIEGKSGVYLGVHYPDENDLNIFSFDSVGFFAAGIGQEELPSEAAPSLGQITSPNSIYDHWPSSMVRLTALNAGATGNSAFQWYQGNLPIEGADGHQLRIELKRHPFHDIHLEVTQVDGSVQISDFILLPDVLELRAHAASESGLRFQWFKNGELLDGETNAVLHVDPTNPAAYTVAVSNDYGETLSTPYILEGLDLGLELEISTSKIKGAPYSSSMVLLQDNSRVMASYDNHVYAYDPSGSVLWTYNGGSNITGGPAVSPSGGVYFGTSRGVFTHLSSDGQLDWQVNLGSEITSAPGFSPDGVTYVTTMDERLLALNSRGRILWTFSEEGSGVFHAPTINANGDVFVGSDQGKALYSITSSGDLNWKFLTGSWVVSTPSFAADGTIYFGSNDNHIYALNPDGSEKWSYTTGDDVTSTPLIGATGRSIYVTSNDGTLYALDTLGHCRGFIETAGFASWGHQDNALSSPSLGPDGWIYFTSSDEHLYVIESMEEGRILLRKAMVDLGGVSIGDPLLHLSSGSTITLASLMQNGKIQTVSHARSSFDYVFELQGAPTVACHPQHTPYLDPGVSLAVSVGGVPLRVNIDGDVDVSQIGSYLIRYTILDPKGRKLETKERWVRVLPAEAPHIVLLGDAEPSIAYGEYYGDLGAYAVDCQDGLLDVVITEPLDAFTSGRQLITYSATDSDGNTSSVHRYVTVGQRALQILVNEDWGLPGDIFEVPVRVKGFDDLTGLQFSLSWDPSLMTLASDGIVVPQEVENAAGLSVVSHFHTPETNQLNFVWEQSGGSIGGVTLEDGSELFLLSFDLPDNERDVSLPLEIGSQPLGIQVVKATENEFHVDGNGNPKPLALHVDVSIESQSSLEIGALHIGNHEKPVVALLGDEVIELEAGTPFVDPGATAVDSVEGMLPVEVIGVVDECLLGATTLEYTATDRYGNTSVLITRTVIVKDTTAPTLSLIPFSHEQWHPTLLRSNERLIHPVGMAFTDPGASVSDHCQQWEISSLAKLDVNLQGEQVLEYQAVDGSGNVSEIISRTVEVVPWVGLHSGGASGIVESIVDLPVRVDHFQGVTGMDLHLRWDASKMQLVFAPPTLDGLTLRVQLTRTSFEDHEAGYPDCSGVVASYTFHDGIFDRLTEQGTAECALDDLQDSDFEGQPYHWEVSGTNTIAIVDQAGVDGSRSVTHLTWTQLGQGTFFSEEFLTDEETGEEYRFATQSGLFQVVQEVDNHGVSMDQIGSGHLRLSIDSNEEPISLGEGATLATPRFYLSGEPGSHIPVTISRDGGLAVSVDGKPAISFLGDKEIYHGNAPYEVPVRILPSFNLSGSVVMENGAGPVEGALVEVFNGKQEGLTAYTDASGEYIIRNILLSDIGHYEVMASKFHDDPVENGVDVYDLVQIRRHILEVGLLEGFAALAASDVNLDAGVNVADVTDARALLLEKRDFYATTEDGTPQPLFGIWYNQSLQELNTDYLRELSKGAEYFIDASSGIVAIDRDPESMEDITNLSFAAIKLGDSDGDWSLENASRRPLNALQSYSDHTFIDLGNPQLKNSGQLEIPVIIKAEELAYGLQFKLEWNSSHYRFGQIQSYNLDGFSPNAHVHASDGSVVIVWDDPDLSGVGLGGENSTFVITLQNASQGAPFKGTPLLVTKPVIAAEFGRMGNIRPVSYYMGEDGNLKEAAPGSLKHFAFSDGMLRAVIATQEGVSYGVEYKSDLNDKSWMTAVEFVGSGSWEDIEVVVPEGAQGYFRMVEGVNTDPKFE